MGKRKLKTRQAKTNDVVQSEPNVVTSPPQKRKKSAADKQAKKGGDGIRNESKKGTSPPKKRRQSATVPSSPALTFDKQGVRETELAVWMAEKDLAIAIREAALSPHPNVIPQKVMKAEWKVMEARSVNQKQWEQSFGLFDTESTAVPSQFDPKSPSSDISTLRALMV